MLDFNTCARPVKQDNEKAASRFPGGCLTKPARSLATLLAIGLALGYFSGQALAAPPTGPAAGEVFFGCTINGGGLSGFTLNDGAAFAAPLDIDYIVIYSIENEFNGQALTGPGTAGPIVCVKQSLSTPSASAESVPIPNNADNPGIESIDILENNGSFILKYKNNNTAGGDPQGLNGQIDNRVCVTAAGVFCALIRP